MKTSKNGFIIPLLLVIAAIILIGGGLYVYKEDKEYSELDTASSTVNIQGNMEDQGDGSGNDIQAMASAGIKGKVMVGPTCPVMIDNDVENTCSDKPLATTFEVLTLNGQFVKNFSSDAEGNFTVALSPGQYKIIQVNPKVMPKMLAVDLVTVSPSTYTNLNISFDSGIR